MATTDEPTSNRQATAGGFAAPTEQIACPLCDHPASEPFLSVPGYAAGVPDLFPLCRCSHCGFVFSNPRVPPDMIWEYYASDYFGDQQDPAPPWSAPDPALSVRGKQWSRLQRALRRPEPGRALDFGCGSGGLVAAMAAGGWQSTGVEPVESFRAQARQTAPNSSIYADLEELAQAEPGVAFDVVLMVDVLEHCPDPVAALRSLREYVKPGGDLVVVVPSIASWERWLFGRDFYPLQLPLHYCQFTPRHLIAALDRAGYRCHRLDHLPVSYFSPSLALRQGKPAFPLMRTRQGGACAPLLRPSKWRALRQRLSLVSRTCGALNGLLHVSPHIRALARPA